MKKILALLFLVVVFFMVYGLIAGVKYEVDNILGVVSGISKEEAFMALKESGIKEIKPLPKTSVTLNDLSYEKILGLLGYGDICINDNKGHYVGLKTSAGKTSFIHYSKSLENFKNKIVLGDDYSLISEKIMSLSNDFEGVLVSSCVVDYNQGLITDERFNESKIFEYDAWFIYMPNSYSTAVVYFSSGRVENIYINWRFFE